MPPAADTLYSVGPFPARFRAGDGRAPGGGR